MVKDKKIRNLIESLAKKIVKAYDPAKIILFGSYSYGNPDKDSDIDLLIIKETSERPIDRRVAVSSIISDRQLRTPVEPIVLTPNELASSVRIGDQFVQEILDKGDVLYEK